MFLLHTVIPIIEFSIALCTAGSHSYLNTTQPFPSIGTLSRGPSCPSKCPSGYKCILDNCVLDVQCPPVIPSVNPPPATCTPPTDPNRRPPTELEQWFGRDVFYDLFPYANVGWGPQICFPYSYESFIFAARYFPQFGVESAENGFTTEENRRRDVAAFFSHSIQETGLNDISLYTVLEDERAADACFYRGGFYNWFEGGPVSAFLPNGGRSPDDGDKCNIQGRYCDQSSDYPCNDDVDGEHHKGCYFGRGSIQISYNFNYGQFQDWLKTQGIQVDLLNEPNLVITKNDPPLAILASLWFYMTPQPPKPAMHDVILGNWKSTDPDTSSGYHGAIFGPTSLIINNECGGEDPSTPGSGGESRRIKAFKWFSTYFNFRLEQPQLLSCRTMRRKFGQAQIPVSFAPDWSTTWKDQPCTCLPVAYAGPIPYFAPGHYPQRFVDQNESNRERCIRSIYKNPKSWHMENSTSPCLNYPPS